jgi:hypothetical protein
MKVMDADSRKAKEKAAKARANRKYFASPKGKAAQLRVNRRRAGTLRVRARVHVAHLVAAGKLSYSGTCSACGATGRTEFHHDSYAEADWGKVRELCLTCHGAADDGIPGRAGFSP